MEYHEFRFAEFLLKNQTVFDQAMEVSARERFADSHVFLSALSRTT